jgi:putative transposase
MTMPRRIISGRTFLITRRTQDRRFLFRPDPTMDQIFLYLVALYAEKFGVLISAAILMSTHLHIVLTDIEGRLPDFMMHLNRIMVLATSCYRRTRRTIWDKRKPSVVELLTPPAMIQKIAYTIANPVADHLVRTPSEWPGTILRADDHAGQLLEIPRPKVFFNHWWPPTVRLRVGWPPALLETSSPDDLKAQLASELHAIENAAASRSRPFMGAKRILRCSPFQQSATPETRGLRSPTFAVGRGRRADYLAAVTALRTFRSAYRRARDQWRAGDHARAFPHGTWWMARFHRASLDPPPHALAS